MDKVDDVLVMEIGRRERYLAAAAYLFGFVSGLAVLLVEKKSSFVRFHAMQAVMSFLGLFFLLVVVELIPEVGAYIGAVVLLFSMGIGLVLMGKALAGKRFKLPWVGEAVEQQFRE